jgi:hypothetical protein
VPPTLALALDCGGGLRISAPCVAETIAIFGILAITARLRVVIALAAAQVTLRQLSRNVGLSGISNRRAPSLGCPFAHFIIGHLGLPASVKRRSIARSNKMRPVIVCVEVRKHRTLRRIHHVESDPYHFTVAGNVITISFVVCFASHSHLHREK